MNKKVNVFGKTVPVFVLVLLGMGLVSAALVGYLATPITGSVTVESPMQIVMNSITNGGIITVVTDGPDTFSVSLHGGEAFDLVTTTTNLGGEITEPVLIEVKVPNFNGVGIIYTHLDGTPWEGNIPVCTSGSDAYYYVGPAGGFQVPASYVMEATSTITTDLALEPKEYTATVQVIKASDKVANCVPLV